MSTEKKEGEILLIHKPIGWTSFDVVKKVRYLLGKAKTGHAGTLDPLASGLLILCTYSKTKEINTIQDAPKEYICEFEIGKTTPSIDLETAFNSETDWKHISESDVIEACNKFVGTIEQVPPIFSAIWVDGKRAYKLAREGKEVELKKRFVAITSLEILKIELPTVEIKINCSKGTYVRSLVRDIGENLGVGAYMKGLVRTKIGDYLLENAYTIDALVEERKKDKESTLL